jgi:hypothetical protein
LWLDLQGRERFGCLVVVRTKSDDLILSLWIKFSEHVPILFSAFNELVKPTCGGAQTPAGLGIGAGA